MSPVDRPVPPPGEDIHIPGPSLHPVLLAAGIMTSILGITIFFPVVLIVGLVLTISVLVAWVRDALGEFEALPADHHPGTHDTVPRPQDRPHSA